MASKTKYDLTKEIDQERFIYSVFDFFDDMGFTVGQLNTLWSPGQAYRLELTFKPEDESWLEYGVLDAPVIH